jgi:prolyl-tRNA synthetase
LCCGANEDDFHLTGFQIERDFGKVEYYDFAQAQEGGICPQCKNPSIGISQGIMVGHICQLGDKHTQASEMLYIDANGNSHVPVMGSYEIGITRLAATICEASHDKYGPIWPISIAPWQVHLCCVRSDDAAAKAFADKLYAQFQADKLEVIYDDRPVSAGVMFADADLLGVPYRVIVSPRNMKEGCCEIVTRNKSVQQKVEVNEVAQTVEEMVRIALIEANFTLSQKRPNK